MDITRNVILDLMPLYLADEASADTRALVEKYLETDPQLANMVKQSARMGLPGDIPVPLTREDEMESYKEAKKLLLRRTVIIAVLISLLVLVLSGMAFAVILLNFFSSS